MNDSESLHHLQNHVRFEVLTRATRRNIPEDTILHLQNPLET
jgi:hypothetical protein